MSRRASGFTMIELLVALVIFLIFIGAVFGIYSAATRSMSAAEEKQEIAQTGRVLLAQLDSELSCAYQSASATTSTLVGENDADTGVKLTFLTTGHAAPADQPAGDLCQLVYTIGDASTTTAGSATPQTTSGDTATTTGLYVQEDFHPGCEMENETLTPRELSPLVTGMAFQYLDASGTWQDTWTDQTTLPVAVHVALTLQPPRKDAAPVVVASTTNLMMATASATTTTGGTNATP